MAANQFEAAPGALEEMREHLDRYFQISRDEASGDFRQRYLEASGKLHPKLLCACITGQFHEIVMSLLHSERHERVQLAREILKALPPYWSARNQPTQSEVSRAWTSHRQRILKQHASKLHLRQGKLESSSQ